MSDTFDHESDAYDDMMDDFYWGRYENSEKYIPSYKSCRYCGEFYLHWEKMDGKWRLFNNQSKLHKCKKEKGMTIKIDKGIVVPVARRGANPKYPFRDMLVGDSFEVDEGRKVSSAVCNYGRRTNTTFSVRKMDNGKFRCWRLT